MFNVGSNEVVSDEVLATGDSANVGWFSARLQPAMKTQVKRSGRAQSDLNMNLTSENGTDTEANIEINGTCNL